MVLTQLVINQGEEMKQTRTSFSPNMCGLAGQWSKKKKNSQKQAINEC